MTSGVEKPGALAMRESGTFLMISMILLTAPVVISLALRRHGILAAGIAFILIAAALPFSSLHVLVRDGRLRIKLGGLITVRDVPLADIAAVQRFRPPSLVGVGIRWLAEGTLYTVTLGDAVEIRLHDGSRFFIGSDTPSAMCTQLESVIPRAA